MNIAIKIIAVICIFLGSNIAKLTFIDMTNTTNHKIKNKFIYLKDISLYSKSEAGELQILKNINFNVKKGDSISIVGPSGAGKTSLLMLLGGLESPSAGNIFINGAEITAMSEDELTAFRQQHIGIIFQNFHLISTMTALENVAIPLEFMNIANAFSKAKDILEKVGLPDRINHYPAQLSGGEQQRVAIARAFVTTPPLLLADEPTGNLDIETGKKIVDLMFDLAKSNKTTIIMVTHDMNVAKYCNKNIKIIDGEIV